MLEAAGLDCVRQGRALFRALSFSLKPGERLRIAGANGSGKTSLLRILCGLLAPNAGEVRWRGEKIASLKEEYSRYLVYLGHAPAVKDDFTPAENLEISCKLAGLTVKADAALAHLGVPADVPVRKLSQGQRRRAALARLLLSADKPLWLLDEPFAALDAAACRKVEQAVSAHVARGGAVVLTTHQDTGLAPTHVVELQAGT